MLLKKIRLRNFRLVEDSTLEPLNVGITGLVGENGSGKSSFLIGLRWVLFGVRPANVKNSDLIRQGALENDSGFECFVDVEVESNGSVMRVVRSMSKKGTISAEVFIDGVSASVDSARAANQCIINFLGETERIFDVAHIVGQDELNLIVNARPADRRKLIQDSAGIDIFEDSLDAARGDLSNMPYGEDVESELVDAAKELRDASAALDEANSRIKGLAFVDISGMESSLSEMRLKKEEYERVEAKRAALLNMLVQKPTPEDDIPLIPSPAKNVGIDEAYYNAVNALRELNAVDDRLNALPDVTENSSMNVADIVLRIGKGKEWVSDKNHMLLMINSKNTQTFDDRVTQCNRLFREKVSMIKNSSEKFVTNIQHDANREIEEIQQFSLDNIDNVCPLCGSQIHDPQLLKNEREKKIRLIQEDVTRRKNGSLVEKDTLISAAKMENEQELDKILEEKNVFEESVKAERETVMKEIASGEKLLADLINNKEEAEKVEKIISERKELTSKRDAILPVANSLAELEKNKNEVDEQIRITNERNKEIMAHNAKQNQLREDIENLNESLSKIPTVEGVDVEAIRNLENEIKEIKTRNDAHKELTHTIRENEITHNSAKKQYDKLVERQKKAEELNNNRFLYKSTVDVLRAYREEMLATLGPDLEESMTELVATMSDGEYVSVRLNEDFGAFVTSASGDERAVVSLSGGERALISLALRMSLGSDKSKGLLWLDEVSSSLDGERLKRFMAGLHNLDRQVIIIDHREAAVGGYDKTIRFEREVDSSRIVS